MYCRLFLTFWALLFFASCGNSSKLAQCAPGLLSGGVLPPERYLAQEAPGEDGLARVGSVLRHFRVVGGLKISEGDVVLGSAGDESFEERASSTLGSGEKLWPGGVIPYELDPSLPQPARVRAAIDHWNYRLSGKIRLEPRGDQDDWAIFLRSAQPGTCASSVGRQGGRQTVYIGDSCGPGNLIHEIGHLVGLWHEQNRQDRAQYVVIRWENVEPSQVIQFALTGASGADRGAYDFDSIMHYPSNAFTSNGTATIETIPAGKAIGQRIALSPGDIEGVEKLYGGLGSFAFAGCVP